jgi:lysophospholipase L1-like esterase
VNYWQWIEISQLIELALEGSRLEWARRGIGLIVLAFLTSGASSCAPAVAQKSEISASLPNIYFSPYNTYSDGNGRLLANNIREGSSYAFWVNPGAYFKTTFTGASAALDIEMNQAREYQLPKVGWSIDDGPLQSMQLQKGDREIQLASHLKAGIHSVWFIYQASDANQDRWNVPIAALKIYGIRPDHGEKILSPMGNSAKKSKRIVFYGDSITEGAWILGNSDRLIGGQYVDWVDYADAALGWPRAVAAALDAEYGVCAFGGSSWIAPTHPFVPPLPESWSFYFANHSRLVNGRLLPAPDYVIVNMGTNDRDRQTTVAIRSWLTQIRQAVGRETEVFIIVPFGQMNRKAIEDSLAGLTDLSHTHKIDLGPQAALGLDQYGHPSLVSFDGLHPKASATAKYAAEVTKIIVQTLNCRDRCVADPKPKEGDVK